MNGVYGMSSTVSIESPDKLVVSNPTAMEAHSGTQCWRDKWKCDRYSGTIVKLINDPPQLKFPGRNMDFYVTRREIENTADHMMNSFKMAGVSLGKGTYFNVLLIESVLQGRSPNHTILRLGQDL